MLKPRRTLKKLYCFFCILITLKSYTQNKKNLNDCLTFKKLATETIKTTTILRNNGNFKLENTAIELLTNTNTLLNKCLNHTEERGEILSTLIEFLIIDNNMDRVEKLIDDLNRYSEKDQKLKWKIYFLKSIYQGRKDSIDKALALANNALEEAIRSKNNLGISKSYWLLGYLYEDKQDNNKATTNYKKAIETADKNNVKKDFVVESIIHIGNLKYQNKEYQTALNFYIKGKKVTKDFNIGRLIPFADYHLGKYYLEVNKDITKSLEYLNSGLKEIQSLDLENYFITSIILQKMGSAYLKAKNDIEAQKYFKRAIKNAEVNNRKFMVKLSYQKLEEIQKRKQE